MRQLTNLPIPVPGAFHPRRLLAPPTRSLVPRATRRGSALLGFNQIELDRNERIGLSGPAPVGRPWFHFSFSGLNYAHEGTGLLPVVSAAQVRDFGKTVGRARAREGLFPLAFGWYSTRNLTTEETMLALMSILPADTVMAGESAGLLYGIEARPASSYQQPFRLCVARPEGNRAIRRPGVRCRILKFEPGDLVRRYGIRCTSALRTALDMSLGASLDVATHVLETFVRRGWITKADLEERVALMRGWRGIRVLREAIRLMDSRSESFFETSVRIRLFEAGLPAPTPQVPVKAPHRLAPFRLDFGWLESGGNAVNLGLECDSSKYHPLTGEKADADRLRREEIERQGWRVMSVRYSELRGPKMTFEREVAKWLKRPLFVSERRPWSISRWQRLRNAWVRQDYQPIVLG